MTAIRLAAGPGGGSWLHRLSPIPKLAWLAAVVAYAFASLAVLPLAAIVAGGLVVAASARLLGSVLRGLLPLTPLVASILVLQAINPAACDGPCAPAAQLGPVVVSADGVARGLAFVARVAAMAVAAFVVFASTRPSDLFAALARLRVPYAVNLATALTLQLVPLLEREARTVIAAQRARGRRSSGPGALVPALVPMFAMTVERAERLAIAMESRGVGSSGPVTSYRRVELRARDLALALAGVAAGIAGVALALAGPQPPPPAIPDAMAVAIFWAALVAFAASLTVTVRSLTRA